MLAVSLCSRLEASRGGALRVQLDAGTAAAAADDATAAAGAAAASPGGPQPTGGCKAAVSGAGPGGGEGGVPAWGNLMSFLRGNVEAVGAASVKKASRGSRAGGMAS